MASQSISNRSPEQFQTGKVVTGALETCLSVCNLASRNRYEKCELEIFENSFMLDFLHDRTDERTEILALNPNPNTSMAASWCASTGRRRRSSTFLHRRLRRNLCWRRSSISHFRQFAASSTLTSRPVARSASTLTSSLHRSAWRRRFSDALQELGLVVDCGV